MKMFVLFLSAVFLLSCDKPRPLPERTFFTYWEDRDCGQLQASYLPRSNYRRNLLTSLKDQYPLHYAAWSGDVDQVEALVNKGADVNLRDSFGRTALHWVTYLSYSDEEEGVNLSDEAEDVVEFLVENKAQAEVQDQCGNTPLHYVVDKSSEGLFDLEENHLNIAKLLLENGAYLLTKNALDKSPYDIVVFSSSSSEKEAWKELFDHWIREKNLIEK